MMENRLPEIPGVDWKKAMSYLETEDMLMEAVTEFCRSAGRDGDILDGFYQSFSENGDEESLKEYRVKVHAMKHSAALIGADELSEHARMLEYAARDRDTGYIDDEHYAFCAEYAGLAEVLSNALSIDTAALVSEYDPEELKGSLDVLISAMEAFDIQTMNDTIDALERHTYPEKIAPLVGELSEAVLRMDEKKLSETAEAIRKLL